MSKQKKCLEQRFTLPHLTIAGMRWGKESKKPVLALHGWLDNAASFAPMADYIAADDLLALDFAGHGKSGHRPANSFYHFVDYVDDLQCLIKQQGWKDLTIIGHSMGGMIAQLLAASFPEYVKQLVLIESFGLYTLDHEKSVEQLRVGILDRRKASQPSATRGFKFDTGVQARRSAGDLTEQSARLLVARSTECIGNNLYAWCSDKRLRQESLYRFAPEQCDNMMAHLTMPVKVIRGTTGYEMIRVNLARYRNLAHTVKDSEVAGGHHLHMDNPEPCAMEINQMLTFCS